MHHGRSQANCVLNHADGRLIFNYLLTNFLRNEMLVDSVNQKITSTEQKHLTVNKNAWNEIWGNENFWQDATKPICFKSFSETKSIYVKRCYKCLTKQRIHSHPTNIAMPSTFAYLVYTIFFYRVMI